MMVSPLSIDRQIVFLTGTGYVELTIQLVLQIKICTFEMSMECGSSLPQRWSKLQHSKKPLAVRGNQR